MYNTELHFDNILLSSHKTMGLGEVRRRREDENNNKICNWNKSIKLKTNSFGLNVYISVRAHTKTSYVHNYLLKTFKQKHFQI